MEPEIITAFVGIFCVILSGGFALLDYYIRTTSEAKKSVRIVLYYFLEIRHIIRLRISNPMPRIDAGVKIVSEKLKEIAPDSVSMEEMAEVRKQIEQSIWMMFQTFIPTISEELRSEFRLALKNLSARHPILAFQINGSDTLTELHDYFDSHQFRALFSESIADLDFQRLSRLFKQQYIEWDNELLKTIDKRIKKVSRIVGFPTQIWVFFHCLRRKPITFDLEEREADQIGNQFDVMVSRIMETYQTQKSNED